MPSSIRECGNYIKTGNCSRAVSGFCKYNHTECTLCGNPLRKRGACSKVCRAGADCKFEKNCHYRHVDTPVSWIGLRVCWKNACANADGSNLSGVCVGFTLGEGEKAAPKGATPKGATPKGATPKGATPKGATPLTLTVVLDAGIGAAGGPFSGASLESTAPPQMTVPASKVYILKPN